MKKKIGIHHICIASGMIFLCAAICFLYPYIRDWTRDKQMLSKTGKVAIKETESGNAEEPWKTVRIDFDELKRINPDIVAWIIFDGDETEINYPILQGKEETEYIHLNYKKQYSANGSIFLQLKNSSDFTDLYSILYGHNMKSGMMFGNLKKLMKQDFYDRNHSFTIYTPNKAYHYEIFSVERVSVTDSYTYCIYDDAGNDYQKALNQFVERSLITSKFIPNKKTRTVALSTCSSTDHLNYRVIVHGMVVDQIGY